MKLTKDQEFAQPGWFLPRMIERHDGREGETALLNGREEPVIRMHAGQMERWRLVNASSARYILLELDGRPFLHIGTDGGLLERARTISRVLITPGERADIVVGPFREGERISITSLPYDRTTMLKAKRRTYGTIEVGAAKPSTAHIPQTLRVIEPLAPQDAPASRQVRLSVGASLKHGLDFRVNGTTHMEDKPVRVGELQVWEVSNASLMDHPFHLHGFFFQVLEMNGQAPDHAAWKDTLNLPPRSRAKIAWMPDNRPGKWMYHCHILEHHAAGMMAHFEVLGADETSGTHMKEGRVHCHG
jgi:FtsP/CotA-like multicopper oxidase with cupredoxin domain